MMFCCELVDTQVTFQQERHRDSVSALSSSHQRCVAVLYMIREIYTIVKCDIDSVVKFDIDSVVIWDQRDTRAHQNKRSNPQSQS